MFFITEIQLIQLREKCEKFTVKKNSLGKWQIEFVCHNKTGCFIRTKREDGSREFKKLDAVYKFLEKCGVESFQVEI